MNKRHALLSLSVALAMGAHAQGVVKESTDPAKAAAIEQRAREIKARQEREAQSGKPQTSAFVVRGKTDDGFAFLSGGITVKDRTTMYAERDRYRLWVATVAKVSGAYLSDAQLRIVSLDGKRVVLERTMDGPWFLIDLPKGRYEITATSRPEGADAAQTETARVSIPAAGLRQAVFRFASSAQVSPEMESPFKGNPFGQPPGGQ
ncbi:MAG: hypothetical protein OEU94_07745 [Aquincola sp.]|nr:hypothetical protein [Aquincola sp.]MDH4289540.1 hypothetical protein [Aquincola sp.]